MSSNRPDHLPALRLRPAVALAAAALIAAATLLIAPASVGAQEGSGSSGSPTTVTTVVADVGPVSECSPGDIVRRPDCGIPPESPTDPGGWLQVSLFYLICAAVVGLIAFVWWRSRVARNERRAAGLDPVDVARARGQGVRRSTRSDPVAETSSKVPDANAGR